MIWRITERLLLSMSYHTSMVRTINQRLSSLIADQSYLPMTAYPGGRPSGAPPLDNHQLWPHQSIPMTELSQPFVLLYKYVTVTVKQLVNYALKWCVSACVIMSAMEVCPSSLTGFVFFVIVLVYRQTITWKSNLLINLIYFIFLLPLSFLLYLQYCTRITFIFFKDIQYIFNSA